MWEAEEFHTNTKNKEREGRNKLLKRTESQRCEKTFTWPQAAESTEAAEIRDLSFS